MHHPGDMAVQTVSSGGSLSPLAWMIIIAVLVAVGSLIHWLFFQDKKR